MANPVSQFFQRLFGKAEVVDATEVAIATPAQPITTTATTAPTAALPEAVCTDLAAAMPAPPTIPGDIPPLAIVPRLQAWKPALPLDNLFFDWIMGYPGEGSNADSEQSVLQALYRLLASDLNDAVIVPRMPTVIPQLLHSLRNKAVSTGELTRHIIKDVTLVGEVINTVNSAMYNPADRIAHLDNAVMMLGEEGLRLVIAKVAFRPIINLSAGQYTRRAAPLIWAQSEKCAIACHMLTQPDHDFDPFHAFLAGLMKNLGLMIALRLLDQECTQPRLKYSAGFQMAIASVAATLSYRIAQRWEFPAQVIQALQQQAGGRKPIDWTPLGHLLHTADLVSKMRVLVNQAQLSANDQQLTAGLSLQVSACFNKLNTIQLYDLAGGNSA